MSSVIYYDQNDQIVAIRTRTPEQEAMLRRKKAIRKVTRGISYLLSGVAVYLVVVSFMIVLAK